MRRFPAAGLALVLAARGGALHADPAAPQVSPGHLQREDAQRLHNQLRGLDREPPAVLAAPVIPPPDPAADERARRSTGVILLGVAAASVGTSLVFAAIDSTTGGQDFDSLAKVMFAAAAVSGITGLALYMSGSPSVQLAPTVTPKAVGLAITGRM